MRQRVESWLAMKGFERHPGPALFDLDGENERSVYAVSGGGWTVLYYSHWEEEARLVRELQGDLAPVLYVWVYDSDAWGWDLFDADGFAGSFASDPRTWQSFTPPPVGNPERPRATAEDLCRRLAASDPVAGDPDVPTVDPRHLRRIERRRTSFMEDVCRDFCQALGVPAAAASYDDLESGALFEDLEGFDQEQWLFVRRGIDTTSAVSLHEHDLGRTPGSGRPRPETVELPASVLLEMKRLRRRVRLIHKLLRPLSWMARGWRALRGAWSTFDSVFQPGTVEPPPRKRAAPAPFRLESAVLKNERHGCRITLAEGVRPTVTSTKPASVFAFVVGEITVTCTARRRYKIREVLRQPDRSHLLVDEKYSIGDLAARYILFELPSRFVAGSSRPSRLALHVVEAPRALYVFLHRSPRPLPENTRRAIRKTVDSFRLLEES